ncbi:MAG: isopentenyl-diphosphate Delta-isomerase [Eubacterium sp.]|nr:isopentenyl-diphosphate Delta-isomerase [Eubacterium sp.]
MEDQLILVDIYDNQIGTMGKAEAHRLGRLHRAFSIFIIKEEKMLIQKRRQDKYHSGGLWANACCSHPRDGETLEHAVHRRLSEEVGFDCELEELFHFTYRSKYAEDLYEYEYDHVFLGEYDGEVELNPEEVEDIAWITYDELARELVEQPDKFSSWFQIAAPGVLERLAFSAENRAAFGDIA